eukprot:CAMPEP_0196654296 /NCGR_PEP_ID=MMETSP1086-20130531/4013_1 /TAXON_ID=77921 /ORGANISM="Cyanoptyche  gloeocystis , Strain SAG4.97" /LENGTH=307 /DNA_ID=CAMNT_0041985981 /DNA_START=28 /DNA_END=951 /DNA_ORIENTATION=+
MVICLEGIRNRWRFSELGARLVSWECLDEAASTLRRVVWGDESKKCSEDAYRGAVMFPWVNRLGGSSWFLPATATEPALTVPVNTSGMLTNLHGLLFDELFSVVTWSPTMVEFKAAISAQNEWYPVAMECLVKYMILTGEEEGLRIDIRATNTGTRPAPVTTGVHPYFMNPFGGPIDDMDLVIGAEQEFDVDAALIPTGLSPVKPEHQFRTSSPPPKTVGSTHLDNGFVLDASTTAVSLSCKNFSLAIRPIANCRYVQVYTPGDRQEIAIEPQSGGADAFRHPEYGAVVLPPGDSFEFSTGMTASFS